MSEKSARAARRTGSGNNGSKPSAKQPAIKPSLEKEIQSSESIEFPGILILRVPQEQPGAFHLEVRAINGLDPFAVGDTLKLAIKIHNQNLGLNEGN